MAKIKKENPLSEINVKLRKVLEDVEGGPTYLVLADTGKTIAVLAHINSKEVHDLIYNFCIYHPKYVSSVGGAALQAGIEISDKE